MSLEELSRKLIRDNIWDDTLLKNLKNLVKSGVTSKDIDNFRLDGDTFLSLVSTRNYSVGNYIETVKYLISIGCDVNIKGKSGWTPLMSACICNNVEVAEVFLNNGAFINLQNYYGETALMYASQYGYIKIVKLLLNSGVDVTIKDNKGKTAYDYAKDNNNSRICKILENYEYEDESIEVHIQTEEELKEEEAKVRALAKRIRGAR